MVPPQSDERSEWTEQAGGGAELGTCRRRNAAPNFLRIFFYVFLRKIFSLFLRNFAFWLLCTMCKGFWENFTWLKLCCPGRWRPPFYTGEAFPSLGKAHYCVWQYGIRPNSRYFLENLVLRAFQDFRIL